MKKLGHRFILLFTLKPPHGAEVAALVVTCIALSIIGGTCEHTGLRIGLSVYGNGVWSLLVLCQFTGFYATMWYSRRCYDLTQQWADARYEVIAATQAQDFDRCLAAKQRLDEINAELARTRKEWGKY